LAIVLIFLIRTVAFFYLQKIERNDFKCILPTHLNSGSLKERCVRNLILTGAMMSVMKMKSHISLTTKNLTQTEIRKRLVDFMTIKIRSPTKQLFSSKILEVLNLNEYERQRRIAESTKKLYPPGTRIELISMKDPYAPVPAGTRGTVKFVDSMGTIFPEWDNGRSLGVIPGEDSFRKLTQEEIEAENQSKSEVEDEAPDEDNGMTMGM
jgi:hypothetical protein